jgi:O-antigen/teichoic acid export membrane protein
MSVISKLNINVSIYLFASLIQKGIGAFLVPIYTRYLSPSEFGEIGVITSASGLFVLFSSFALDDAVMKFSQKENGKNNESILGAVFLMNLLAIIFTILVLLFWNGLISRKLLKGVDTDFYIYFVLLSVLPNLYVIVQKILIRNEKSFVYAFSSFLFFLLNSSSNIYLLVFMKLGTESFLISSLIANSVFFVWSFYYLLQNSKFKMARTEFCEIIYYCWPLFLNRIISWGGVQLVVLFVAWKFRLFDAGIYSLLTYVNLLFNIFSQAIGNAVMPKIFRLLTLDNFKANVLVFHIVERIFIVNVVLALSIVVVGNIFFVAVVGSDFIEAKKYILLVVLSSLISSFGGTLNVFFFYFKGKQTVILYSSLASTLVIVLMIHYLSSIGIVSIYLSSIIGASVVLLMNLSVLRRMFGLNIGKYIVQVIIAVMSCFFLDYLKDMNLLFILLTYLVFLCYYYFLYFNNHDLFRLND